MRTTLVLLRVAVRSAAATLMAGYILAQTAEAQQRGELLYEAHCVACHTVKVHWRAQRLVWNWPSLLNQIRLWQSNAELAWTESDIADVAHYLNQRYYRLDETAPQLAGWATLSAKAEGQQPWPPQKALPIQTAGLRFDARQRDLSDALLACSNAYAINERTVTMVYQEPDHTGPIGCPPHTTLRTETTNSSAGSQDLAAEPGGTATTHRAGDVAHTISCATGHARLLKADALCTAGEALRGTDGVVHLHPYRAIGIAAGLALLVGYMAARR